MPNYRVLVTYDPERNVFHARAPELEHCSAEGATRTEALVKLEEEIEAQLRNMREQGGRPPAALDEDAELSGALNVTVSRTLHRDLAWQARNEGVEIGVLVGEILAAGLESRRQRRRPPAQPEARSAPTVTDPEQPPRRDDRRDDRRGGGGQRGQGGRYHAIMEDRATFLEYVRGLESGGGRGPGYNSGGNPGGGGGGGRGPRPRGPRPGGPGGGRGGAGGGSGGGSPDEGGT